MREDKRYATVVAVFAAALFLACVVAAFGVISLALNIDVIDEPDAGPLVGPIMAAVSTLALFGFLNASGRSLPPDRQRIAPGGAVLIGLAIYVIFIVSGGSAYTIGTGQVLLFLTFTFHMAGSWFSIATGILAFLVTLAYQLVLVGRFRQRGRPEWPWEHNER
jgi:Family of unknown function (DUF6121)